MKGKRHHLWVIQTENHAASGNQSSCGSCLTWLSTWRTCLQVQTPKESTLRITFANITLPLRLPLGYDIVSAEEHNANNNIGGLNTFQIHGTLCHCQGPLLSIESSTPSYAQLHIYDPSYDAQRWSERNENLDNKVIENSSTLLSQCNPFARIYRHAYEILSNHESSSINSEDRANNNSSAESRSPYIISVHRWECIWLKEASDVLTTCQRWKTLSQLFLFSILTEASVTSFLF